ncbi:hypothetical protein [Pantoea sp. CCBC3-3-1]|uniref:hypothetical protein n=1 Tax=Pantoea sp. CCBC3-3-1 TaxID=2490851 RepID=UPI0011BD6DF5|nr:hypothetical protein [Pantoea sp. CCBC3-3-1]
MKVSRKQMTILTALARAHHVDDPTPYTHFSYVDSAGHYSGTDVTGNIATLERLATAGIIRLHGDEEDFTVELVERADFLSGWFDGARAAQRGEGTDYSSYCSMPMAFVAGHQHWHEQQKPSAIQYKDEFQRRCHGFPCVDTGEIWKQE